MKIQLFDYYLLMFYTVVTDTLAPLAHNTNRSVLYIREQIICLPPVL